MKKEEEKRKREGEEGKEDEPHTKQTKIDHQGELKQWLEGLGIDAINADRYAQAFAKPEFDYTTVSQLIAHPPCIDDLKGAGVLSLRHRNIIIQGMRDTKDTAQGPIEPNTKAEVRRILSNIPSASTYGNPSFKGGFKRNSELHPHIAAHRCNSGTPVVLLDPVLSELYDDVVNNAYVPTFQDCKAAKLLMELLSTGFEDEVYDMQPKVRAWAVENLGWNLGPDPGKSDSRWTKASCLVMSIDMKKEKGTGTVCSYMQNNGHYVKCWTDVVTDRKAERSNCPSILLELTGPEISVNGAVLTNEGVLVDPFITASLLCNVYDYNHLVTAARIVGAVTKAANKLKLYYQKITEGPDDPVPCDGFPIFRSFPYPHLQDTNLELIYKHKLKELLYVAEIKIGTTSKQVIVKFAHSYSVEAHKVCFSQGCAPQLYFAGQMSRFKVIVMEYILNAKQWNEVSDGTQKSSAMKLICKTIEQLHKCFLVHGDLRSSNILLDNNRVAIIDFDWSGSHNQQTYPFFMNHTSISWPNGVEDGKPLAFQHDLDWIKRSFV